jgi:hypothetical protein
VDVVQFDSHFHFLHLFRFGVPLCLYPYYNI